MICVNCGSFVPDDSNFCIECGAPIQGQAPVGTTAQPAPQMPPTPQMPAEPEVQPEPKMQPEPSVQAQVLQQTESAAEQSTEMQQVEEQQIEEPEVQKEPVRCPSCGMLAFYGRKHCLICGGDMTGAAEAKPDVTSEETETQEESEA